MHDEHTTHPGIVLNDRFLGPRGMSVYRLALAINVPSSTLERFVGGRTHVTRDLAKRLGEYFDTDSRYWLDQQQRFNDRLSVRA
ncbi:HigA family addiction module antitoxin [Corynebacterium sp. 335C]